MSTFDDPNRESVGLAPIWTGAGEEVAPEASASKSADPVAPAGPEPKAAPKAKHSKADDG
jgi:hypothetical protein